MSQHSALTAAARPLFAALVAALSLSAGSAGAQTPAGPPLRIGGTMALTGPLGPTGLQRKIAADIAVEQINRRGGLLGRPIEYIVRDDQSKPDVARTIYEQLVTVDKMDLLAGPYGTANILSAMSVAQRYNKLMMHSSFGMPNLAKYDMQFSTGGQAFDVENVWPAVVFDALASTPRPPVTVAFVANKFPSTHFVTAGAREAAKKRGLREVLYLDWDFGNRDFGPIAGRIKEARADFVWVGALGLDGNLLIDAMKKIDYAPPLQFHLLPAPGPLAKSPDARNVLSITTFEEHAPFLSNPVAVEFVKAFHERGAKAGLPDTSVELQAAAEYATWQVLEAAVKATKSFDDKVLAQWLKKNRVDTLMGQLRWDGPNNFIAGPDLYKVKQLQQGKWMVVWPKEFVAPGVKLIAP